MSQDQLVNTRVSRCGATAKYLKFETAFVRISERANALQLFFAISSKGGGSTELYVEMGPADFGTLLSHMSKADRLSAMNAMSAELARQTAEQPIHDRTVAEQARDALRALAQEKYEVAADGAQDIERLIYQRIKKLVEELDEATTTVAATNEPAEAA